jgi:hypothetical protein
MAGSSDAMDGEAQEMIPALEPEERPPSRGDLEDAFRFTLHTLTEHRLVQADVTATLKALIQTLLAAGAFSPEAYEQNRQRALDNATLRLSERPMVRVGPAVDKYALDDLPEIDCASILPICKARCCRLTVCLSSQDLDERVMVWDYAKPYQIRRKADGYCTHSEHETGRCGVYQHRPAICRTYDCRQDKRIWVDFEKRIIRE